MRVAWGLAALSLCGLAGCVDVAPLVPGNAQAQAAGPGRMNFARGIPGGPMRITLANGEVLPGTFSISEATAQGNFTATAHDARVQLTCRGNMSSGHGTAECQGTDGAVYQLQL